MRRGSDSSPVPIRLPAPASSSSSPTDECRVFANLSPLEKAVSYIQRFKGTNNYTSRRQLFTSPHQGTMFKEVNRTANDALQIPRSDKEIITPSECVQECLADPDELNSINSPNSMSDSVLPNETIRKPDDGDSGTRDQRAQEVQQHKMDETTGDQLTMERSDDLNNVGSTVCLRPVSREQSVPQGNEGSYSIILNGVEYDVGNLDGRGPSSSICIDGGSHSDKFEDAGGGYDKQGRICQPPSECNKIVDASQDYNISSRPVSDKDAMDTSRNQCGTETNLQSETANVDSRSIARYSSSYTSENPTNYFAGLSLPASQLLSDVKHKGICSYALPISNSGSNINSGGRSMKPVSRYGNDLMSKFDCSSALLSLANTQHGDLQENQNAEAATSNDSHHLMQVGQHQASCEENNLVEESTGRFEELNQMSPKRKRKRATITSESDGCKLCNCKRSKCLKLYCECFAAGIYCLDTCACVNCFNKPEYEDTVLDARQQIESRNPHAFAPKVIKHAMDSPRNVTEDRNGTASSSARHKRGCNCKKSKCRKKYCECYQSKVGCSDGCRCDNCQNSFGARKETVYERVERWKNESHEKMITGQTNTDSFKATGGAQFSSAWQELDNTSNFGPSAVHSTPSNLWNYTQVSQSQLGNRFQADASFHWQYPPQS